MSVRGRIEFMDCPFDSLTEDQVVERCLEWRDEPRRSHLLITANVAILMMMRADSKLREACRAGEVVTADGMPVVWATRLLGTPLVSRVSGCDLMERLLREGDQHKLRVFFLGAKEEVLQTLVKLTQEKYPGVVIAGARNGYFSPRDYPEVIQQVRDSRADILFVGMPTPFKETWCHEYQEELCTPVLLGVGGSFDVLAGHTKRAPVWMQRIGMEWFWRFLMDPRRMWKRYLVTNTQFLLLLGKACVQRWLGLDRRSAPAPRERDAVSPANVDQRAVL